MTVLDKIQNKTNIDIKELIKRLQNELGIEETEKNENILLQLEYSLYDTMIIILDVTHQKKIPEGLYTTWIRMTKDYWYLNGYDKLEKSKNNEENSQEENLKIKSIQLGDTTTNFVDQSSQVEINGVTYSTGTIKYSEDALLEKYKIDLYRHRKMRW